MEPWGFEPQIPPCHGGVIPFHYGPQDRAHPAISAAGDQTTEFIRARQSVNLQIGRTFGVLFSGMIEGPYIIPAGEAEVVKRRLSEARVWCLSRYKADDSRGSLRSPELRPELPFTIERRGADGDLKYDSLKTTSESHWSMKLPIAAPGYWRISA